MGKFLNGLKKALSLGVIDKDGEKFSKKPSRMTNKILYKELVDHFEQQMEELSVGNRILYPMSFNIMMHPDDYDATCESFPFILPEVLSQFYAVIKKAKEEHPSGRACFDPPATYWFFQFTACQVGVVDDQENIIKPGEIVTIGSLTTFDIRNGQQSNVRSEANVVLSVKCQNSVTNKNNINMDALLGMDIMNEGSFTFDFDKNLSEDTQNISGASMNRKTGWAKLRWSEGNIDKVYEMMDNYIDISGNAEMRNGRNILKIQSDDVVVSHVQIKYDQVAQIFYLAAFAKTRLNGREVPISSDNNPSWVILPRFNSRIFLNDSVSIEFNANPD